MKKIMYMFALIFLSVETTLLCQVILGNGEVQKQQPPKPPSTRPDCIDDVPTGNSVAPCCDVKVPFRYNPGEGDRLEPPMWGYDPDANNG